MSLEGNRLRRHDGGGGHRSESQTYISAEGIRNGSTVVKPPSTAEYTAEVHPFKGLLTVTPRKKGRGQKLKDIRPQGWVVKK